MTCAAVPVTSTLALASDKFEQYKYDRVGIMVRRMLWCQGTHRHIRQPWWASLYRRHAAASTKFTFEHHWRMLHWVSQRRQFHALLERQLVS